MIGLQLITSDVVVEKTTRAFTLQLTDELGANLAYADISEATLTIYDQGTGEIVNTREDIDIRNANGGEIDANGSLRLTTGIDDNVLLSQSHSSETHICLIKWKWDAGAKGNSKSFAYTVVNEPKVE